MGRESGFAGLPERHARYAVLLHRDMQGLVVGSEEPRRLAVVPLGTLQDPADHLLLSIRNGWLRDPPSERGRSAAVLRAVQVRLLPTLDRHARIERMIEHYRLARNRLLDRRATTLWRKLETEQAFAEFEKPPERVH